MRATALLGVALTVLGGCGTSHESTFPRSNAQPTGLTEIQLAITPIVTTLRLGDSQQMSVSVGLLGSGVPPSGPLPRWSTSDSAVLAVTQAGVLTAVGPGSAELRLTAHGATASQRIGVIGR